MIDPYLMAMQQGAMIPPGMIEQAAAALAMQGMPPATMPGPGVQVGVPGPNAPAMGPQQPPQMPQAGMGQGPAAVNPLNYAAPKIEAPKIPVQAQGGSAPDGLQLPTGEGTEGPTPQDKMAMLGQMMAAQSGQMPGSQMPSAPSAPSGSGGSPAQNNLQALMQQYSRGQVPLDLLQLLQQIGR